MWIFIWVILSLFILGVFFWSVVILYEQKTAWAKFAKKNKLQYTKGKFMESAIVSGNYQGFRFSLHSNAQQTEDVRGQRYVSVIEFEMGSGMGTGAALGTKEMAPFIGTLSFNQTPPINHEKWKPDYIVKTRGQDILAGYLTPQRLSALGDIFAMNRVTGLFFFDEQDCVLHLETVDPLRQADRLDRIIARIAAAVRVLAVPEMLPENRKAPVGLSLQPAVAPVLSTEEGVAGIVSPTESEAPAITAPAATPDEPVPPQIPPVEQ